MKIYTNGGSILLRKLVFVIALSMSLSIGNLYGAATLDESVNSLVAEMRPDSLDGWKYIKQDIAGAEKPGFDDSSWKTANPEFDWGPEKTIWFRKVVTIPDNAGGISIAGTPVYFAAGIDDSGECYVNGELKQAFDWDKCRVLLTEKAVPGEKYLIAIKSFNGPGNGRILFAHFDFNVLSEWRTLSTSLTNEISVCKQLIDTEKDKNKKQAYSEMLAAAIKAIDVDALNRKDMDAFKKSVDLFNNSLKPMEKELKEFTVHLIGHGHIDMNWLWLWPETIDVCRNTFTTMLKIMDLYPDFKYSQSQASTYIIMEELYPDLFKQIQQKVKEGRWEITGGTWTEGDMNMASGESIVRQIMYAKRYFQEKFGVESEICWEPDTFGHAWTIPQILAKSGIKYYYFCRCAKDQRVFWWEGPDGSRVLAYNFNWYSESINDNIKSYPYEINRLYGVKDGMAVYGVGDHGGGPTMQDLTRAVNLQKQPLYPTVKFNTAKGFYDTLLSKKTDWPVINDELNFVFQGCYTTHADIKKENRVSENLLPTAEAFAVLAGQYGYKYPQNSFVDAWRNTCFNQFHDIFDGSAIHDSYIYSKELFDKITTAGNSALSASLGAIARNVRTSGDGVPIIVFNPLAWTRTDVVTMHTPGGENKILQTFTVKDANGRVVPSQSFDQTTSFLAKDIPSMGYKTFYLTSEPGLAMMPAVNGGNIIENEFFTVKVDQKSGTITSIFDKKVKREVIASGQSGSLLQILMEKPHGMSAWDIGPISKTIDLDKAESVNMVENNSVQKVIRVRHKFNKSSFTQDIILHAGVPRIDVKLTADWQEKGDSKTDAPFLKVAFPANVTNGKARFEIPFGSIERPANGDEVPSQKWTDLSGDGYGVSILNDCKYGTDVKDNVIRLSLLRASYDPDPAPDMGPQSASYSIYPHKSNWQQSETVKAGYEFNNPLIPVVAASHEGKLPETHSFLKVDKANIIVTALKKAEDSNDMILRFYECKGETGKAKISFGMNVKSVQETDLSERPGKNAISRISDSTMSVPFGKWEIKTLKLSTK